MLEYPGHVGIELHPQESLTIRLKMVHKPSETGINRAAFALLRAMGFDLRSQHFEGTPRRLTKMWMTYLTGHEVTVKAFQTKADSMVITRNHQVVSMCPHHMLPIVMMCDFAYVPSGWVVGLSKIPRIMDVLGASFVLQEEFTDAVVNIVDTLLMPKGVAFRVSARHGCMRMRGVRTPGLVITQSLKGVMLTDEKARTEAMSTFEANTEKFPESDQ